MDFYSIHRYMEKKCKISIITVTFNAEKTIEETIKNVINQTYSNIEYIIIDGGSTDNTISIIRKYEEYIDKWISEPDKGIYDAMNKGIDYATGEWINFMNAGDLFTKNTTIEDVFNYNYLNYDCIYGDRVNKDFVGLYLDKADPFFSHKRKFCPRMGFSHQCTFVKSSIAKKLKFSLNYKIICDYEMMYEIYQNNGNFLYRPIPIAICNIIDGYSISNFKEIKLEYSRLLGIPQNIRFKIWLKCVCLKNYIGRFVQKKFHFRLKKKQEYLNN